MPSLQFKGKTAVENYHHTVPHHTFEFDEKLSVLGKGEKPSLDGNLIIEGDNLLALKALLPTYAGRVKCIYIDPPYNTGEEGWVYNDNLKQPMFREWIGGVVGKEGEDATRHDKWCCMVYPRLQLLKQLLDGEGSIFVSIDDNEYHNLRLLMDEVFGLECYVATIVWQKRTSPDARLKISPAHDYIVVYVGSPAAKKKALSLVPLSEARKLDYKNPDNDSRGPWASVDITGQTGHATKEQYFEVPTPTGRRLKPPKGRCWAIAEKTLLGLIADGRVWFGKAGNARPRLKKFLSESEGAPIWTWWPNTEVGHNQEATKELAEILGAPDVFDNPKPVRLIRRLLEIASRPGDVVLDSFGGSGTTAHAALLLGNEQKPPRTFVVMQMPFDTKEHEDARFNICREVTAERVRRVIGGYEYDGTKTDVLLEEKVGLRTLKDAPALLARIETVRANAQRKYDEVKTGCDDGVVRVHGIRRIKGKTAGLGGTFSYARLSSEPLFGQYRDIGSKPPTYEDLAKYILYTETSRQWQAAGMDKKTGKIGEHGGTSYYLLYKPGLKEDMALDRAFLDTTVVADKNKRLVVYCEKIWVHRAELREWEAAQGKTLRPMVVPFNLK